MSGYLPGVFDKKMRAKESYKAKKLSLKLSRKYDLEVLKLAVKISESIKEEYDND